MSSARGIFYAKRGRECAAWVWPGHWLSAAPWREREKFLARGWAIMHRLSFRFRLPWKFSLTGTDSVLEPAGLSRHARVGLSNSGRVATIQPPSRRAEDTWDLWSLPRGLALAWKRLGANFAFSWCLLTHRDSPWESRQANKRDGPREA